MKTTEQKTDEEVALEFDKAHAHWFGPNRFSLCGALNFAGFRNGRRIGRLSDGSIFDHTDYRPMCPICEALWRAENP